MLVPWSHQERRSSRGSPPGRARRGARALLAVAVLLTACGWAPPLGASVWPSSHERVARALKSTDDAERRAAAAKLLGLPPEIARPLVRQALLDADVEVRLFAARSAVALGLAGAGDLVVGWLSDIEPRLREAACEVIEVAPSPHAVQALARVLGDANQNVRRAAAAAMGSSGRTDAVAPLLGHLDDSVVAVRLEVVRALGRIADQRAVVPLVSKLQDPEAEVREAAARALGTLGDARGVATLMLALQDPNEAVRVQALEALGLLRAEQAIVAITALLSSAASGASSVAAQSTPAVLDAALRALGRIATPPAVRILVDELEREGRTVASAAARGAGSSLTTTPVRRALVLAGPPAATALTAVLRTTASVRLGSSAALALGELRTRGALPVIIQAAQRGTVSLDAALHALAALDDLRALPFLLEQLDDPDSRIRLAVLQVARGLLDPARADGRAVDPIRPRLLDLRTPLHERIALVQVLGRTGSPRAQKLLLGLASTEQPDLQAAVVEALGELGLSSKAVDAALLKGLDDPSARLRLATAMALGRVGHDQAARHLLHRLGVSAEQDRGAIGIALSGSLSRSRDPKLVGRVQEALGVAPAAARDALIEGLGRLPVPEAGALLAKLAAAANLDDRRKVAEALSGHAAQESILLGLLGDPDPAARANAVWALGRVGTRRAQGATAALLGDLDVAVAGNAAIALARMARRSGDAKAKRAGSVALCKALSDYRSYVRANALVGLRTIDRGCPGGRVRHLLLRDRSWRVRLAAGDLLFAHRGKAVSEADQAAAEQHELDVRALGRCLTDDKDATVAAHCRQGRAVPSKSNDVLVFVVPHGRVEPTARAPYALELADGALRLGVADRRGALFERDAPGGIIRLAVPAALAP